MASKVAVENNPGFPSCVRVSSLVDMLKIYEPDVQVCVWQREQSPEIVNYLNGLTHASVMHAMESCKAGDELKLGFLPDEHGRSALAKDLEFLTEIVFDLTECDEVGLRFARLDSAMCPGWHYDRVGLRLICTYQGPGTEWLNNQDIDRRQLQSSSLIAGRCSNASTGDVVLLKGSLWQGNEKYGAIHRSPGLDSSTGLRTVITLDPLWSE